MEIIATTNTHGRSEPPTFFRKNPVRQPHGTIESPRSLSSSAFDAIGTAIVRGVFPPGMRLRDEELKEQLGYSRTPIRDALTRLESAGLVEIAASRFTKVTTWTENEARTTATYVGRLVGIALDATIPILDESTRTALANEWSKVSTPLSHTSRADRVSGAVGSLCRLMSSRVQRVHLDTVRLGLDRALRLAGERVGDLAPARHAASVVAESIRGGYPARADEAARTLMDRLLTETSDL